MIRPRFHDIGVVSDDIGVANVRFLFTNYWGGLLADAKPVYDGDRMAFRPGVQSMGGIAAARKLSEEQRRERAKHAARAPRRQYGPKPKSKAA